MVSTTYPARAAPEVESEVSQILEDAVATVAGIDELRSISRDGNSMLLLTFNINRDIDAAAQDVRDAVNARPQPAAARHRSAGHPQAGHRLVADHDAGRLRAARRARAVLPGRPLRQERHRVGAGRRRGQARRRRGRGPCSQYRGETAGRLRTVDHPGPRGPGPAERRGARRPRRRRLARARACARWAGSSTPAISRTWSSPPPTACRSAFATWAKSSMAPRRCARWPGSTASRPSSSRCSGSRAPTRSK